MYQHPPRKWITRPRKHDSPKMMTLSVSTALSNLCSHTTILDLKAPYTYTQTALYGHTRRIPHHASIFMTPWSLLSPWLSSHLPRILHVHWWHLLEKLYQDSTNFHPLISWILLPTYSFLQHHGESLQWSYQHHTVSEINQLVQLPPYHHLSS